MKRLLTKPLADSLSELQEKVFQLEETDITNSINGCIEFILIEVARLDMEANQ